MINGTITILWLLGTASKFLTCFNGNYRQVLFRCCCLIYLKTVKANIKMLIKTILKLVKNFKTLDDLSPNFMKEIFYRFLNLTHRKDNPCVHTQNRIEWNKIICFPNKLLPNYIFKYLVYNKNIWYSVLYDYLI